MGLQNGGRSERQLAWHGSKEVEPVYASMVDGAPRPQQDIEKADGFFDEAPGAQAYGDTMA